MSLDIRKSLFTLIIDVFYHSVVYKIKVLRDRHVHTSAPTMPSFQNRFGSKMVS